jgi:hypothetical protein
VPTTAPPSVAGADAAPPSSAGGWRPDERSPRRRRIAVTLGLVFAVATFGLWIYAIFFYDPGLMIDELADRTFPNAAEQVCAAAAAQLDELPAANLSPTPADRAVVVHGADAILASMVDDLETIVPTADTRVDKGIAEWVSDWRDHVADREAYATKLETDPDARFEERTKGTKQLSKAIDSFAAVNRMQSCETPGDVG